MQAPLQDFSQGRLKRGSRKGGILLLRSPHDFLNYNRNVILNATGPSNPCPSLVFPLLFLWPKAFRCSLAQAWREDQGLCAEVSVQVRASKQNYWPSECFAAFPFQGVLPVSLSEGWGDVLETCKHHAVGNGVNVNSIGCFISCPFV